MNRRAQIFTPLVLGIALGALAPFAALAAAASPLTSTTNATAVATVSIQGAALQSVEGRTAHVSFSLYNRTGVQPDIRYALKLVAVSGGVSSVADQSVADETLTLSEGQTVSRTMSYTAPARLAGTYQIWIEAATSNGLPLGAALAGKATFPASNAGYATIPLSSCFLTVSGDAAHHALSQTLLLSASPQTLQGTCTVKSHFSSAQTLTPSVDTYKRSRFGARISSEPSAESVSLSPGETKTFTFSIPLGKEPQAYVAAMTLRNQAGESVSNPVSFTYLLAGNLATILNVVLDKNGYANRDTAHIAVSWSGASAASSTAFTLGVALSGRSGSCAPPASLQVPATGFGKDIAIPVSAPCSDPSVSVTLTDENGTLLDQKNVAIPSRKAQVSGSILSQLMLILLTLVVLGGALFVVRKAKRRSTI